MASDLKKLTAEKAKSDVRPPWWTKLWDTFNKQVVRTKDQFRPGMLKAERMYCCLYPLIIDRYIGVRLAQDGSTPFSLESVVEILNLANDLFYGRIWDEIVTEVEIPLLEIRLDCPTGFRYRGLRVPEINLTAMSLIAFRSDERPDSKYATTRIGRVITAVYADIVREVPALEVLVNYVAENATIRYVAERGGERDSIRVLIDHSLKAFEYAYLEWDWKGSSSCMAVGNPCGDSWAKFNDNACSSISDNIHCQFYNKINTRAETPWVKIAMLLDGDNKVLARCLLWRVGQDEANPNGIWYADRMYYGSQSDGAFLRRRLYEDKQITYNKIIGTGCGEVYNIEDQEKEMVPIGVIADWAIPLTLDDGDALAYMDTFKEYSSCNERISTSDDYDSFTLSETANQVSVFCCSCCDHEYLCAYNEDEGGQRERYVTINGQPICDECTNLTVVCANCDTRIWEEDAYEEDDKYYCEPCHTQLNCFADDEEDGSEEDEAGSESVVESVRVVDRQDLADWLGISLEPSVGQWWHL